MLRMVSSEGGESKQRGAPESRDRDAGGWTDVLLKKAKEASV